MRGFQMEEHGRLVTVRKMGTIDTIFPHFLWQRLFGTFTKSQFTEEFALVSERQDTRNAKHLCLLQTVFDKTASYLSPLCVFGDGETSNFSEVFP